VSEMLGAGIREERGSVFKGRITRGRMVIITQHKVQKCHSI
jgi:hypothetical protein